MNVEIIPFHLMPTLPPVIRIIIGCKIDPSSGCWNWLKCLDKDGYGHLRIHKKFRKAHRVSYEIFNGQLTKGMSVLHKCDNPRCVNPDHLFLGNQSDNIRDMKSKMRHSYGERNGMAKLDVITVLKIKTLYKSIKNAAEISRILNLPYGAVKKVCNGTRWKYLNL